MQSKRHKNTSKRLKDMTTIANNITEELQDTPLTEYQISDRADKEDNKKLRVVLFVIVGITITCLIFAAIYAKSIT